MTQRKMTVSATTNLTSALLQQIIIQWSLLAAHLLLLSPLLPLLQARDKVR